MKLLRSFRRKKAKDGDGASPLKEAEASRRKSTTTAAHEERISENSKRASKEINGLFPIPPPEDGLKQETGRTEEQDGGQPLEAEQVQGEKVPLIVLVHGIGGHWKTSWEYDANGEAFSWVQNFLYHDLRKAGLSAVTYSYGYDSRTISNSVADIEQVSLVLLGRLKGLETEAPIVFVAHSLGGLVVKKAMIEAWNNNDRYGAVLERIKACVFLGVPHRGADNVWWKTMSGRLVTITTLGARGNNRFTKSIDRASNQWWEIGKKFVHRSPKLKIHSFYETNKTGHLLIVDEYSARMNLPNEHVDPLGGSDHIMLSKFGRDERERYQPVGNAITEIVKEVGKVLAPVSGM